MVWNKVAITSDIMEMATQRAKTLPIFDNSHRKLEANIIGCIGEILFEQFLKADGVHFEDMRDNTDMDYIVNNRYTFDVKTKDRTVPPREFYECSVPLYNHNHQKPNYYYFISLERDKGCEQSDINRFKNAYLLGGIDQKNLHAKGKQWNKDEVDTRNGTRFWTDCLNVEIKDLIPNNELLKIIK